MPPVFLNLNEVLKIHRDQIQRYGGDPGIRDIGLLESEVAMPRAGFGSAFLHNDLFEMAAAYLFHIAQTHTFIDGNKRTGTASALVFLEINNIRFNVDPDVLADMVLAVAEAKADKTAVADFFRKYSK